MTRLLLALVFSLSAACCVSAASPVEDYIAARDAYLKQFKDSDDSETVRAAHQHALDDLEGRLRNIIGPSEPKGFANEGKVNLESLAEGDQGFGLLDGMVYAAGDDKTHIVVTTRELLDKWLAAHAKWWGDQTDMPEGLEPALKSEAFYTQALSTDAYFYKFVDIPVTRPAGTTFAYATLIGRAQDDGLQTPNEVVVSVLRGGRVYVIVAPAAATAETTRQCAQGWQKAEKQALQDQSDKASERRADAYRTYRRCFAAQAPRQGYFAALAKQAQGLVGAVPK
jgi:hypothetical protein